MICETCGSITTRIFLKDGIEHCPHCSVVKENRTTEGLLTQNASRIRMESLKYEGDMIPPKRYDKSRRKVVPNEEFLKRNGTRAKNFFREDELEVRGYKKLANAIAKEKKELKREMKQFKDDVIHEGNKLEKITEFTKDY